MIFFVPPERPHTHANRTLTTLIELFTGFRWVGPAADGDCTKYGFTCIDEDDAADIDGDSCADIKGGESTTFNGVFFTVGHNSD